MKLKDVLSKIAENKKNGQLTTCLRKTKMKYEGFDIIDVIGISILVILFGLLYWIVNGGLG